MGRLSRSRRKVSPLVPFSSHVRERYGRILATAGLVLALAAVACGSPAAANPVPASLPVTATSVRSAFDNSTMQNAHFKLHGTLIVKGTYFPVTGDGVLQLVPREALSMNFRIQTYSSMGILKFQEVTIGGRVYSRTGTGRWTSKPETSSMLNLTSYVGEEIIGGAGVWHAQGTEKGSTTDVWIRESDGYIVRLSVKSKSGTLILEFDTYNKSRVITKP